jgi:phage FluMu protein Com
MSLIISHHCLECGYKGDVSTLGRKVKCPGCGTINDFWLINEEPPNKHKEAT